MLISPVVTRDLSNGRGRIYIDISGSLWIQQGRPFGVMAVPGEAELQYEDFATINAMYAEFFARGYRIDPPGTIRPL